MELSKLFETKRLVYSLEVFPPKKNTPVNTIYSTLAGLQNLPADFISVTYGAGGSEMQRSKTCEIASLVRSEYYIEPVAHLTCVNSTKEEVKESLRQLRKHGIHNILALRGDINPEIEPKKDFSHASDLARFIKEFDPSFHLSGACYPEGHYESDSLEQDVEHLKYKIENGVQHLITQLFFDNEAFYRFLERIEAAGITVPIEAGIMPIVNKRQIERTISMSGASLPNRFSTMINRYADKPAALKDAGIFYATEQILDLMDHGVRGIHLYTMNQVDVASRISRNIQNIIAAKNAETEE